MSKPTCHTAAISGAIQRTPDATQDDAATAQDIARALVATLTPSTKPSDDGLAILFASDHYATHLTDLTTEVRTLTNAAHCIAVRTTAPIAGRTEFEETPALSLFLLSGNDLLWHAFTLDHAPPLPDAPPSPEEVHTLANSMGVAHDAAPSRATILFVNALRTPLVRLIPALSAAMPEFAGPLLGGLASGMPTPGATALALNGEEVTSGVGVTIRGPITIDAVISQAARPIGEPLVVTKARSNVILQLGGRSSVKRIAEIAEDLDDHTRDLLSAGPLLGRVVDEYKNRFGPGDFVIRSVLGLDAASGSIAVADFVRPGQTVQFHVRDADTAHDDLAMLLEAQQLRDPAPIGALLIPCVSRGTDFFEDTNHDATLVADAFTTKFLDPGIEMAKAGIRIAPDASASLPVAGFFADGEIGPLAGETFLHNHSACVALFRPEA